MRDIATELAAWCESGRRFALASVIGVSGSAPRPLGTALAVDTEGNAIGGVSGGCVEAAVYERCLEVLDTGQPVVDRFGYSDDDAFAVGLTCGGTVEVLVSAYEPDDGAITAVLAALGAGTAVGLARVIDGPRLGAALTVGATATGSFGSPELDAEVRRRTDVMLDAGESGRFEAAGWTVAVESYRPPPRLLVFGAIDFAAALVRMGKLMGYHVTVCDARPVFATRARFPEADEVVVDWPHRYLEQATVDRRTAVCVLTHDAKFDIPLLERALRLPVGYVGAMGSRRTHRERTRRLIETGLSDTELAELHSPIGLDLGGRSAEETALSILAEITAESHGATGKPLSAADMPRGAPVHGYRDEAAPSRGAATTH